MRLEWSNPKFDRHRCRKCGEDLTNKLSIGGRLGNECIQCYCQRIKISEDLFREAITNRRCYQCEWEYDRALAIAEARVDEIGDECQRDWGYGLDLAIKPAIIHFESGIFQGLLCFRCRYFMDRNADLAKEKKFEVEKKFMKRGMLSGKADTRNNMRNGKVVMEFNGELYRREPNISNVLLRWSLFQPSLYSFI